MAVTVVVDVSVDVPGKTRAQAAEIRSRVQSIVEEVASSRSSFHGCAWTTERIGLRSPSEDSSASTAV